PHGPPPHHYDGSPVQNPHTAFLPELQPLHGQLWLIFLFLLWPVFHSCCFLLYFYGEGRGCPDGTALSSAASPFQTVPYGSRTVLRSSYPAHRQPTFLLPEFPAQEAPLLHAHPAPERYLRTLPVP